MEHLSSEITGTTKRGLRPAEMQQDGDRGVSTEQSTMVISWDVRGTHPFSLTFGLMGMERRRSVRCWNLRGEGVKAHRGGPSLHNETYMYGPGANKEYGPRPPKRTYHV